MRTADLTGAPLDYWTARAEGVPAADLELRAVQRPDPRTPGTICVRKIGSLALMRIDYSTNWALCGPLVEKHEMEFRAYAADSWAAGMPKLGFHKRSTGSTAMIAICRAVVRAAFGDEVEDLPC